MKTAAAAAAASPSTIPPNMDQANRAMLEMTKQREHIRTYGALPCAEAPKPQSLVWPHGVGLTAHNFQDPDESTCSGSCDQCSCWMTPVWFAGDDWENLRGTQTAWTSTCCGFSIHQSDVLFTQTLDFEGTGSCCGCCCCWREASCTTEPAITVFQTALQSNNDERTRIGTVKGPAPSRFCCCNCCAADKHGMIDFITASDANGTPKFYHRDLATGQALFPPQPVASGGVGEFGNHTAKRDSQWVDVLSPIYRAENRGRQTHVPVAQIVERVNLERKCCSCCSPTWTGVRHTPGELDTTEQKLLLAMAVMHWWKGSRPQFDLEAVAASAHVSMPGGGPTELTTMPAASPNKQPYS